MWKAFTLTGFVYRRGPNLFNKLVQANIKACPKLTFLAPLKKNKKEIIHVATVPSVRAHA